MQKSWETTKGKEGVSQNGDNKGKNQTALTATKDCLWWWKAVKVLLSS